MQISATDNGGVKVTIGDYSTIITPGCLVQLKHTAEGGLENRGWSLGRQHTQPQRIVGDDGLVLHIKTEGKEGHLTLKDGRAHKATTVLKLRALIARCDEVKAALKNR